MVEKFYDEPHCDDCYCEACSPDDYDDEPIWVCNDPECQECNG